MKKKLKVLHLLSSNVYSGAENVACTIIKNYDEDYNSIYCCPEGKISSKLQEMNINYAGIKKLSYSEVKKVIKKERPDIIHAHDYKASCLAALFHKYCPIISHIHSNNTQMNFCNIKTIVFKFLSKYFQKIIWVSDSSLNGFYYNKYIKDKSLVLYNVIDADRIVKRSEAYDCKERYDVIYLGRLTEQKNPERLIEVCKIIQKDLPKLKVAIVGDGDKREIVKDLIINNKLENNIKMFGYQENPYPILKNSKILLMTSRFEGTPMCALEAMSFGLPIVSTPVDGLKKIIKNDLNGYLFDDNDELANIIVDIIKDKKLLKKLSVNSKEEFARINDMDKFINKIKKVYKTNK